MFASFHYNQLTRYPVCVVKITTLTLVYARQMSAVRNGVNAPAIANAPGSYKNSKKSEEGDNAPGRTVSNFLLENAPGSMRQTPRGVLFPEKRPAGRADDTRVAARIGVLLPERAGMLRSTQWRGSGVVFL